MNESINKAHIRRYRELPGPPGPGGPPEIATWATDLAGGVPSDPHEGEATASVDALLDDAIRGWDNMVQGDDLAPGPCPKCKCAIFHRRITGRLECYYCDPPDAATITEKLVVVDDAGVGLRWGNLSDELRSQQARRDGVASNQPDASAWDRAIDPVFCETCGGCPWWDGADRPHCERCNPPNKQELWAAKARQLVAKAQPRAEGGR